jgi:hypothetical protein
VSDKKRVHWSSRARTYALTELTHEHWELYRYLLVEEYAMNPQGRPQSRARTRLARRYPERLREIYYAEMARLKATPEELRHARRPRFIHVRAARSYRGRV